MSWGVQTWDANGVPNNYGIKPVSVYGTILLSDGQKTGSWSITVPAGLRLNYYHVANTSETSNVGLGNGRRRITVSGNSIIVSSAGDTEYAADTYQAARAFLVITIEKT
ncbi:hypothetical protein [Klebsiella sp. WP3-W18-ESBL-02]|uniref:hypothetical protein n=1 Tax=Klebsiella sp. WP3-W18-ESBL-02 TaxID=2675710 RepID=UPI0015FFBB3C|nr:hypothetical protein [Klebsiella sp. WP3-W18-ESBL-02]